MPTLTLVGPDNITIKSADGVILERTRELADEPSLFVGFGSGVSEVLNARLVIAPLAGAVRTTVKFVESPFARTKDGHVTMPLLKV